VKHIFSRAFTLPLLLFAVALTATFGPVQDTKAATFETGGLTISYADPSSLTFANIKPGDSNRKEFTITNSSPIAQNIALGATSFVNALSTALTVTTDINGVFVWQKTLADLAGTASTGVVVMPSLAVGQQVVFGLTIGLPTSAGNEFQNLTASGFSFVLGSQIGVPETSSGGGGTGSNTPTVPSPSPSPSNSPRLNSNPLTLTAPLTSPTPSPTVAAAVPDATASPTEAGNVLGVTDTTLPPCFWWWLLPLFYALFLIGYRFIGRGRKIFAEPLWPALVAIGLLFLHSYLHKFYAETPQCTFFPYLVVGLLAVYYIFLWMQARDEV
jgi:hypothetical protein